MATNQKPANVLVFDLNQTFYNKSSKDEFFKFVCAKKPHKLGYYLQMVWYKLLLKLNQIRQTEFKENFFNYLDHLPPEKVTEYAKEFWQQEFPKNFNAKLKKRFTEARKKGDLVFCATGGLELYVKPLFDLFPIDGLVGTKVTYNGKTYLVEGKACKREEKLNRIVQFFKGKPYTITEAYSDSKEDILDEAEKAFLLKNGKLEPY